MFANDLIVFYVAGPRTVKYLVDAFGKFSNITGLAANKLKSQIIMGGCKENHRQLILQLTEYQDGRMPFRYLAVPTTAIKLSKMECSM